MSHDHEVTGAISARALTRRQALLRGSMALVGTGVASTLLEACGGASSASGTASGTSTTASSGQLKGHLILLSYPGWYGPNEFADFHKLHPGLTVSDVVSNTSGDAAQIAQIADNKGAFDLTLGEVAVSAQLAQAGLLAPFNAAAVPNINLVAPVFRKSFPWGIPTDLGKMGIGYRSDLIPERPTSWHDLWQLAQKYSGKLTVVNYDADVQGTALKYCGYSVNTTSAAQLQDMQKALLTLKPHIQSLTDTDHAKPLIEGTAYLAMDYDYDLVVAQQSNKNIVWVAPTEGMTAYLEGWTALKDSKHLAAVWEFMNFHMAPINYASFINANGPAYVEPAAVKYIKPVYADAPALKYSPAALKNVEFEGYLGPEQVAYRAKLWEEFLAA
jgi:spermidine/putrescine transport system substrate-binding protein